MRESNESLLLKRITELERLVGRLTLPEIGAQPVFLQTPLTSTAWDGDARSSKTLTTIDMSAVFGVPAGIKAVLVRCIARDSGSLTSTDNYIWLGIGGIAYVAVKPQSFPNDMYVEQTSIVPCDANGDIQYVIHATGVDTMDVYLQILGYWK